MANKPDIEEVYGWDLIQEGAEKDSVDFHVDIEYTDTKEYDWDDTGWSDYISKGDGYVSEVSIIQNNTELTDNEIETIVDIYISNQLSDDEYLENVNKDSNAEDMSLDEEDIIEGKLIVMRSIVSTGIAEVLKIMKPEFKNQKLPHFKNISLKDVEKVKKDSNVMGKVFDKKLEDYIIANNGVSSTSFSNLKELISEQNKLEKDIKPDTIKKTTSKASNHK